MKIGLGSGVQTFIYSVYSPKRDTWNGTTVEISMELPDTAISFLTILCNKILALR